MNRVKIRKDLDEKGMTKTEAYPLWIWRGLRNNFVAKTLRRFVPSHPPF